MNGMTSFSTTTTSSSSFNSLGGGLGDSLAGMGGMAGLGAAFGSDIGRTNGDAQNGKDMLNSIMDGLSGISGGGFAKDGTDNMVGSIQAGAIGGRGGNIQDSFTDFGGVGDIMGGSSGRSGSTLFGGSKSSFFGGSGSGMGGMGFQKPSMPKPSMPSFGSYGQ